jgi:ATP-dependent RNA helicase DDX24/MAK5
MAFEGYTLYSLNSSWVRSASCTLRCSKRLGSNLLKGNVPLAPHRRSIASLTLRRRFQQADKAILLATDVAARGLDIPKVDHVVHFQLPRTSDTYIHRSGRTGRAGQSGVTLQLVAPEEKSLQKEIMQSLGRGAGRRCVLLRLAEKAGTDVKSLATLPVEWSIVSQLKTRIVLAKQIDQEAHKATKQNHDEKWLAEAAEAMEIDLDDLSCASRSFWHGN